MKLEPESVKIFVKKFLANAFAQSFITRYYGDDVWADVVSLLNAKLNEVK